MRLPATGLLAAVLLAGVAGCSLPEVLPLAGGTTSGPSPYGPWYEQHWATNAVLLAATDEPAGDIMSGDVAAFEEDPGVDVEVTDTAAAEPPPAVEIKVTPKDQPTDFDSSSPYQFPSSAYAPRPATDVPADTAQPQVAPSNGGAIRY